MSAVNTEQMLLQFRIGDSNFPVFLILRIIFKISQKCQQDIGTFHESCLTKLSAISFKVHMKSRSTLDVDNDNLDAWKSDSARHQLFSPSRNLSRNVGDGGKAMAVHYHKGDCGLLSVAGSGETFSAGTPRVAGGSPMLTKVPFILLAWNKFLVV